jgi:hypothetical protein
MVASGDEGPTAWKVQRKTRFPAKRRVGEDERVLCRHELVIGGKLARP